jgi:hypothetical protein
MLLQVSPAWIVYSEIQPGSSIAVGEADDVGDKVPVAIVVSVVIVYSGGEVKAYPVLEHEDVSDAKSEAKSSL